MEPVIKTVVSVIVPYKHGFVFVKTKDEKYGFPGGKVETFENIISAAERELLEETNLIAKLDGIVGIYQSISSNGNYIVNTIFSSGNPVNHPRINKTGEIKEILVLSTDEIIDFYLNEKLRGGNFTMKPFSDYLNNRKFPLDLISYIPNLSLQSP